jgi:predicted transglutaminase-like cysteine proteinase
MDSKIFNFLVSNKIRTLQDYSRWLTDNIEYYQEGFPDPWIYPEEMLASRRGDCEDYALLTMNVLQVLGFQPKVLALVRIDRHGQITRSHAICVVKFKAGYLWFDNGDLKEAEAGDLQQLAEQLMAEFNYSQTAELNMQTMSWTTLYERA